MPSYSGIVHCEMCGRPVRRRDAKIVYIEGARLLLCPQCYSRVAKKAVKAEVEEYKTSISRPKTPSQTLSRRSKTVKRGVSLDKYEVVDDYAERVRKAREKLGWTQRALAEAVREGENVIRRIESGRLRPSIELAMRLEKVLGIKLLEPVVDNYSLSPNYSPQQVKHELTLGDIVSIRKKGRRE